MAAPTPEQIQAFKERNASALRLAQQSTPAKLVFDSRRGRGDADAQEGGFYGGGFRAPESAPPKATEAPTKGQSNLFTGLADALNKHQKDLEKQHPGYVADEYVFEFSPPEIGASKVVPPAQPVNYKNTAAKNIRTAADKVDNNTDSVNVNSQTWQILAGTQIVQLIDQIMRSSSYITDQAKVTVEDDGTNEKNQKANPGGVTAWYKISVGAQQLKYDTFRRDHAYRITFLISAYKINQMCSIYFNDSKYLGPHKAYDYWFTGLNTQILSYEQEYNQAYYTTVTQSSSGLASAPPTGRDQMKQAVLATSEQRTQGQANYVNAAADSAAAFLYSIADFAEVNMRILGDPAWMQQGEVAYGVSAKNFEFSAFNSDGAINYDSQQVTYTVSFNRPTDYDFNTGIMNTNSGTGAPQETFRFQAKSCKNIFSKGRFEQELVGVLIPPTTNAPPATNSRPTQVTSATNSRSSNRVNDGSLGFEVQDETGAVSNLRQNEYGDLYNPTGTVGAGLPSPQPAPPPGAPSSSGDIVAPGNEDAQQVAFTPPPAPATADQLAEAYGGTRPTSEEIEARNAYIAAGAPSTGPLREAYVSAGAAFNNRAAAAGPTASAQPPQPMNRET
jgi:hypothetical protein